MLLSENHRYSILFAVDLLNVEMAKNAVVGEIRFAPCLARTSYQPSPFIRHWHHVNKPPVCGFPEVFLVFCIVVIAITPFHKDDREWPW